MFDELGGPPQFRIARIPVRIEWPFFIFAALLGLNLRGWYIVAWVAIVFVSVLVHEFGHAIVYRLFGQHPTVHITPISGATHGERPLPRGRSIAVSLAGSVFAFVLLAVPALWFRQHPGSLALHPNWYWVVFTIAEVNLWWSIFNVLPIVPLDGGHVAESLTGPFRARILSVLVAGGAAIWVDTQGQRFVALFLVILAVWNGMEAYRMRQGAAVTSGGFRAPMPPPPPKPPKSKKRKPPKSRSRKPPKASKPPKAAKGKHGLTAVPDLPPDFADLPPQHSTDPVSTARLVASAWEALRAGDGEGAELLVDSAGSGPKGAVPAYLRGSVAAVKGEQGRALNELESAFLAGPPPNLVAARVVADAGLADKLAARLLAKGPFGVEAAATLATHLHYASRYAAAAHVGELVYADGRASQPQTAFEVACAWAQADDPRRGLEWLTRAVDVGFKAPTLIDHEADLEPVRALPGYAVLRERLRA